MKVQRVIVFFVVLALFLLSSCAVTGYRMETEVDTDDTIHIDSNNLPNQFINWIFSSRWAAEISQEQKSMRIFEDFIEKFNNHDIDGITMLFCAYGSRTTGLENQIKKMYTYMGSTIESYEGGLLPCPVARHSEAGRKRYEGGVRTIITTDIGEYHFEAEIITRDDFDPNNEGIRYIYIAENDIYQKILDEANEDIYGEKAGLMHGLIDWPVGIYIEEIPVNKP